MSRTKLHLVRRTALFRALPLCAALAGCSPQPYQPQGPTAAMQIGSKKYELEIAATREAVQQGLRGRDSLPDEFGMILVLPADLKVTLEMRDTKFPLDIILADDDGYVVGISTLQALDIRGIASGSAAMYVIELNAGQAAACGIKNGDILDIPPEIRAAGRKKLTLQLGRKTYELQTAADQASSARGLMFRVHMAPSSGMIFVFDKDTPSHSG